MTAYRTGRHWGVTIVAEDGEAAELVAVVTNGSVALAERICTLLNDVDIESEYQAGVADALAEVAERVAELGPARIALRTVREILEGAAAKLSADEDAPSARSLPPQGAETGSVVPPDTLGGTEASTAPWNWRTVADGSWASGPIHPTCLDVTTIEKPPGSQWMCGPDCPRGDA